MGGWRRHGGAWAGTLALGLAAGLLAGCGRGDPRDAQRIDEYSQVGDCLRPDPTDPGSYRQAGCDDDGATVEIVAQVNADGPASPVCPEGTDLVVDGLQGPIVDGDITGVAQTWCLRNLRPPHPGDPGMGGGELVVGDCFDVRPTGTVAEAACAAPAGDGDEGPAGDGDAVVPRHRLVARAATASECPDATVEPIELNSTPAEVLCAGPV
jgi:hypothetical protein